MKQPTTRQRRRIQRKAQRTANDLLAALVVRDVMKLGPVANLTSAQAITIIRKATAQINNMTLALRTRKAQIEQDKASN